MSLRESKVYSSRVKRRKGCGTFEVVPYNLRLHHFIDIERCYGR